MSNAKLNHAVYSINEAVKRSHYKSFASRNDLKHVLVKCTKDLHQLGFKVSHVEGFKPKHIFKLVEFWQKENKNPATIKNYIAKLRELGRILDNPKLVKIDNSAYNLAARQYKSEHNRGIYQLDLNKCTNELVKLSLEGQKLFGLRREESIKIVMKEALKDGYLVLKPSWTKGGIGRAITIRTQDQKDWIMRVQNGVAPGQSLIPEGDSYKEQLNRYIYQTRQMGLNNLHGLRHAYAQARYKELCAFYDIEKKGWECPFLGGKLKSQMSAYERAIDTKVKHILTRELGHSRPNITEVYLG